VKSDYTWSVVVHTNTELCNLTRGDYEKSGNGIRINIINSGIEFEKVGLILLIVGLSLKSGIKNQKVGLKEIVG
jgi:hypothetical protein